MLETAFFVAEPRREDLRFAPLFALPRRFRETTLRFAAVARDFEPEPERRFVATALRPRVDLRLLLLRAPVFFRAAIRITPPVDVDSHKTRSSREVQRETHTHALCNRRRGPRRVTLPNPWLENSPPPDYTAESFACPESIPPRRPDTRM